ncbi:MAG TPA: hypothetical protein VGI60_02940 [Chthoniobacterales bacterium]|jgi:hypothetical protein
MTLIVSWVGIDTHGPASIYIAADSRISWNASKTYDYGRKVFALKSSPDIFGYCGDVLFPSLVLSQILEMADAGLLYDENSSSQTKFEAVKQKLIYQFSKYPHAVQTITSDVLEILHASRDPTKKYDFTCNLLRWTRVSGKWESSAEPLPKASGVLFARGSGAPEFNDRFKEYAKGPNAGTSRNVFHCFCDTLFNTKEPTVGGSPQLVGLIRKPSSNGINFGVVRGGQRYYLGARIDELKNFDRIEWINELFEICDGQTCARQQDAQPQPNPHRH